MSLRLRTADPRLEPPLLALIDAAFERPARESRLARELARASPGYDPGLALVAERGGQDVGFALVLPRVVELLGCNVPLAIAAPIAVLPAARGSGVGRFLWDSAAQALRDRGLRGALALGLHDVFQKLGFGPAFNLYTALVRQDDLPREEGAAWRGLAERDLAPLCALHAANYAGVSGREQRHPAAIEWESAIPNAHTLVWERDGVAQAYVRFRVGAELELRECAVRDRAALDALLGLLQRLRREHGRSQLAVHVPPIHPLGRELFHRGCPILCSNFRGAAMLAVVDWPGLLSDLRPALAAALERAGVERCSLAIGAQTVRLELEGSELRVASGAPAELRVPRRHLALPQAWAAGLFSGQRHGRELLFDPLAAQACELDARGERLLGELFAGGTPMWNYGPAYEIADD